MRPLTLVPGDPPWLDVAKAFEAAGINEYAGPAAHPLITGMLQAFTQLRGGKWAETDETAWCAAFACACMEMAGIDSPRHALANKWLHWGVELTEFRRGCVVVLDRHVTFGLGIVGNQVACLGGNQANSVCERNYQLHAVKGFRWPNESV
jgi:uncharacterized protein (TIGR02594 family)